MSVNLLSNNEQRNEFTHELDSAIDMYWSPQSVPFFRNLLNERQYMQSAEQLRAIKKEEAMKAAAAAKRAAYLRSVYSDRVMARVGPERYESTMRRLIGGQGRQQVRCPVCQVELHLEGCPAHDIPRTEDVNAKWGGARPLRQNVVHVQWLADWERRLVVVSQTVTKTVHVTTGLDGNGDVAVWESEPKPVTFDRFFVVMVEEVTLRFESERELEVANQIYFGRGVGLGKWMVQTPWRGKPGTDPRKPKSWTVFEPVEEFHGPLGSADEAELICDRWKNQLNDEFHDHFDSWIEVER